MELGGILAGIAVASVKANGKAAVNDRTGGIQHFTEHQPMGGLVGEGSAVPGAEYPVTGGKAPRAGHADDADGSGGAAGGNGGDEVHRVKSFHVLPPAGADGAGGNGCSAG